MEYLIYFGSWDVGIGAWDFGLHLRGRSLILLIYSIIGERGETWEMVEGRVSVIGLGARGLDVGRYGVRVGKYKYDVYPWCFVSLLFLVLYLLVRSLFILLVLHTFVCLFDLISC